MANLFQVSEIVNIGIEDEVTGEALYRALAEKAGDPDLRNFYQAMVEKEQVHERRFRDLLMQVEGHEVHESYPGEYEAYLRALLDEPRFAELPALRSVGVGNEAVPAELVREFLQRSKAELWNGYGPTETTIVATYWRCRAEEFETIVPIGYPTLNTERGLFSPWAGMIRVA